MPVMTMRFDGSRLAAAATTRRAPARARMGSNPRGAHSPPRRGIALLEHDQLQRRNPRGAIERGPGLAESAARAASWDKRSKQGCTEGACPARLTRPRWPRRARRRHGAAAAEHAGRHHEYTAVADALNGDRTSAALERRGGRADVAGVEENGPTWCRRPLAHTPRPNRRR
eukprot:366082-Chlamydomonas_euryale.AAC.14